MSDDTPIIVPFEDTDLPELISIVERVWYLDGDESKETSRSLATIDISYYIGVSTHRFVAKQDGQILGLIFCSNGETPADFEKWQKLENETTAKAKKLLSEARFKDYEIFGDVESHLVHDYWNTNTNDAKWEITLFCVNPAIKSQGIGGMLFSYVLDFMKEQGAKHLPISMQEIFKDESLHWKICSNSFWKNAPRQRFLSAYGLGQRSLPKWQLHSSH